MPPKIDRYWEGYVFALSEVGMAYSEIIKKCQLKNFHISKGAIHAIVKRQNIFHQNGNLINKQEQKPRHRPVRSKETIAKVFKMATKENPNTQRHMASITGVSQACIHKIIHQDLALNTKFKRVVHRLTQKHIRERKTCSRLLYENYLAADRWKFVVTLDEAWLYLSGSKQERKIFYSRRDGGDLESWYRQAKESYPKGFMVVAGFSYNGKLKLRKVDRHTKINSAYYQTEVLNPIFHQDIPSLYGNDVEKVWVHQDKASSHTSTSTANFLEVLHMETKINTIPFAHIPVKSPDASPMDFCAFGILKNRIRHRRPTTLDGLWKVAQTEWRNLDLAVLRRALLSWKIRCRGIAMNNGYQIEHLKHKNFGL
jgi:hypothetical protein